jgi:hypothetical protein
MPIASYRQWNDSTEQPEKQHLTGSVSGLRWAFAADNSTYRQREGCNVIHSPLHLDAKFLSEAVLVG